MDISLKNDELIKHIADLIDESIKPSMRRATANKMDGLQASFTDAEQHYLGMYEPQKDATKLGIPKYKNRLVMKEVNEILSYLCKRLFSSSKFGDFKTPHIHVSTPEEMEKISQNATLSSHDRLVGEGGEFTEAIRSFILEAILNRIAALRVTYSSKQELHPKIYKKPIGLKQLNRLQKDPTFEFTKMEPVDVPAPPMPEQINGAQMQNSLMRDMFGGEILPQAAPAGATGNQPLLPEMSVQPTQMFAVEGIVEVDRSSSELDLIKRNNLIVDKYAGKQKDITLIGEKVSMTRQQLVAKFQTLADESQREEVISKVLDAFPDNLKSATDKEILWDVYVKVQEGSKIQVVRAVALKKSRNIIFLEEVGFIPIVLLQFYSLPDSFEGISIVEAIAPLQNMLTVLERKQAMAVRDTATPKVAIAQKDFDTLVEHRKKGATQDVVQDISRIRYHSSDFQPGIGAYLQGLKDEASATAGKATAFDPNSSAASGMTRHEAIARDETANSMADDRLIKIYYAIKQIFEIDYQQSVKFSKGRWIYNPQEKKFDYIDYSEWPTQLQFLPAIGLGRGTQTQILQALDAIFKMQLTFKQAGVNIIGDNEYLALANDSAEAMNLPEGRYFEKQPPAAPPSPTPDDKLVEVEAQKVIAGMERDDRKANLAEAQFEYKVEKDKRDEAFEKYKEIFNQEIDNRRYPPTVH